MSMHNWAVEDYGLVLDKTKLKSIASRFFAGYSDAKFEDDPYEYVEHLRDKLGIEYIGEFTGEAFALDENGRDEWGNSELYDADTIYYCPVIRFPGLCIRAYPNMESVYKEFKSRLGKYLTESDIRESVRHIVGTYFG